MDGSISAYRIEKPGAKVLKKSTLSTVEFDVYHDLALTPAVPMATGCSPTLYLW